MAQNISGEVTRIMRFENGYTILTVDPDGSSKEELLGNKYGVTLVGTMPAFVEGMVVSATVEAITHAKYGQQYKVIEITESGFSTKDAIIDYLSSPVFRGIGRSTARKIVDVFGMDTMSILDKNPEKIHEVAGMSEDKGNNFIEQWQEQRASHQIMAKLMGFGMTMGLAAKAFHFFGVGAMGVIEENPYSLIKVPGIGFRKADEVAIKMGIKRTSPERIKASIEYVLDNVMWSHGHCYLTVNQVLGETSKLLENDVITDKILTALHEMQQGLAIVQQGQRVYMSNIWFAENLVAERIKDMLAFHKKPLYETMEDLRNAIKVTSIASEVELDPEQEEAIFTAVNSGVCIITGSPGTGKTTITKTICQLFDHNNISYELCSPTGRAAKRLSEATDSPAQTIHRLLKYNREGFQINAGNPLTVNCVLVDEFSMVDLLLCRYLLDAVQFDTRMIMIGDADQLPSVGPGNVLRDLIDSGVIPCVKLTKIFRQNQGSTIISIAHEILSGKVPQLESPANSKGKNCMLISAGDIETLIGYILTMVKTNIPKAGYKMSDIQILTPMRGNGLGINDLNPRLQEVINPPSPDKPEVKSDFRILRVGDKIMHIRNDYIKEVFNGDIGHIVGLNKDGDVPIIYVQYPDKEELTEYPQGDWQDIQLAFSSTVHKSQGAEYPVVLLVLHPSQHVMLQRNLFYTALTRAKKLCIIAGTPDAIQTAVNNNQIQKRNTTLREKLITS